MSFVATVYGDDGTSASATVTISGGGLPAGVTLQAIDGGPTYYQSNGMTYAAAAGWDSPSFFPIGAYYAPLLTQSDAARWLDLGLNTGFRLVSNTGTPALAKSNGIWLVPDPGDESLTYGSETIGFLAEDEPATWAAAIAELNSVPAATQAGRFWWINNTWNFIQYGPPTNTPGGTDASFLSTRAGLANRHFDIQSVDIYWFTGASDPYQPYGGHLIYGTSGTANLTADQDKRGSHYGDMVDLIRKQQTTYPAPILQFVENGGPYTTNTNTTYATAYTTPAELNAGVWSAIMHGARMICYFNHSFGGPGTSDDNLAQTYFQTVQSGQTTSIYAQTKATNALVKQLAPVINSPTAVGYVTVNPAGAFPSFSGFDVTAKYAGGGFTVIALPRYSETLTNQTATFTTADKYSGPVTVVNENRTVTAANGVFSDVFATANTVHIYQIP